MASNLILTTQEGGTSLTFHGNKTAAVAANNLQILTFNAGRRSPWEQIKYPGNDGIRAKFQGAQPIEYIIVGVFVTNNAGENAESDAQTAMDALLALNARKDHYTISSGGTSPILHKGPGVIVTDISTARPMGKDTGPRWEFNVTLVTLGA